MQVFRRVAIAAVVATVCSQLGQSTFASATGGNGYRLAEVVIAGQPVVQPQDITNAGAVVGFSGDSVASVSGQDDVHGFILRHGVVTTIDRPDTRWTYLTGLSENGVAAGYSGQFDQHGFAIGPIAGFTYDEGFVSVDNAGYGVTFVTGINDRGHVVGFSVDGNGAPNGFEWVDGAVTDVSGPNGEHIYPTAITEPDAVVVGRGYDYWSFRNATHTPLSAPAPNAVINDMNNGGDLVGAYFDGKFHGFVYRHGELITVDYPGADETRVNGINDHGAIVGEFLLDGVWRGFRGRSA